MPEPNLCRHCFSVMEEGETVCTACGRKSEEPNPEQALPPDTILAGRYRIGMVLHHNDLLTTYLAWDTEKERKVPGRRIFPRYFKAGRGRTGHCADLCREQNAVPYHGKRSARSLEALDGDQSQGTSENAGAFF